MMKRKRTVSGSLAVVLVLMGGSMASHAKDADSAVSAWLGNEITITASEQEGHVPVNGKFTLIYDAADDVYRACTRTAPQQKTQWQEDWRTPCGVALNLVKGVRYCELSDIKAGNAEVLSTCHRLRSRDVAMHPSAVKGGVELHDVMIFLLRPEGGKKMGDIAMLLDSPARVTHNGIIHGVPP